MLEFSRFLNMKHHAGRETSLTLLMHILTNVNYIGECWEWKGSTDGKGYGQIRIDTKLFYVTRVVAWLTYQFNIEDSKKEICHSCDNPKCINPSHLFVGDREMNVADMVRKYRQKGKRAKPNEKDLSFISHLENGDNAKVAGEKVGYSRHYSIIIKTILIPYWEASGAISKKEI